MELTDIRLKTVKYYINSLNLQVGSTSFDVPRSMVHTIQIENDYDNTIYPFFYIAMNLPGWVYIEVAKDPNNVFISLDLKAAFFTNDIMEKNPTMVTEYKGKYTALTAVETPIIDEYQQIAIEKADDTYKKNYSYNETYLTEFALYNTAYYKALSATVNAVLSSASMTSIVTYVLQNGKIRNTLMTPLSNRNSYSEFKVLPINAVDHIKHLMKKYTLHSNGTIFFMDLDKAYLIDKNVNCTAWYTNEYKSVHIMALKNYNDSLALFSGYYNNSKDKYHLLATEPNSIQAVEYESVPGDTRKHELEIYTSSAIMEALTPNKSFVVNIDSPGSSKNINGKYRIRSVKVMLTPGGDYLDPEFQIRLVK